MANTDIIHFAEECTKEYLVFMGLNSLPSIHVHTIDISEELKSTRQLPRPAYVKTPPLTECNNLFLAPQCLEHNEKALVFHELTHILDAHMHSNQDLTGYIKNTGYTEYHGKQVELMKRLGANHFYQSITFSMSQEIESYGYSLTVQKYLHNAYEKAVDLLKRDVFPVDAYMLKDGLGLIFNYLGCRSVCIMQNATDFNDDIDDSFLEEFVGKRQWDTLKRRMNKRLSATEVMDVDYWFGNLLQRLMSEYNVTF